MAASQAGARDAELSGPVRIMTRERRGVSTMAKGTNMRKEKKKPKQKAEKPKPPERTI